MTGSMANRLRSLSNMSASDPLTLAEIERLPLEGSRPVVICDVDEVIFHFLEGLENHLQRNDCWLDPASFALTGNIRSLQTNDPVSRERVGELLFGFFAHSAHSLKPISGAQEALSSLSYVCDIILLTNLPRDYLEQRQTNLKNEGFDYPIVMNRGHKGLAVNRINQRGGSPVFFLDDSPTNIEAVSTHSPETILIHFMQDERFRQVMPDLPQADLQAKSWQQTKAFIDGHIDPLPQLK